MARSSRSFLFPLTILFLTLSSGNVVVAALFLFHAPTLVTDHAGVVILAWTLFFLLQCSAPLIQIRNYTGQSPTPRIERLQWYAYAAMGVLSTMFAVAIVLEIVAWIANLATASAYSSTVDVIWFSAMTLAIFVVAVLGVYQATSGLKIKKVEVHLPHLPVAFDGYRIVQISDLHVSSLIGRRYTQMVVDRVNGLSADLIAMTGDFIDGTVAPLRYRIAPLATLQSFDGRYFVTGNHEYYYGAEQWVAEHRRHGTTVLLNEHRVIERQGAKILIAGVTDRYGGHVIDSHKQNIPGALAGAPEGIVKILLAHQPGCFEEASQNGVDLQLSGHTHGGQFFPWQFVVKMVHRYSKGLYLHNRMWIYVNPGTGFWGPPLRATIPPEITVVVLRRG